MNNTNQLISLQIRKIKSQITIKNAIILFIIACFVYRYFTFPLIENPVRQSSITNPPIAKQIKIGYLESCTSVCRKNWKKCIDPKHVQIFESEYNYYHEIADSTNCDNLPMLDCFKVCNSDLQPCFKKCKEISKLYIY